MLKNSSQVLRVAVVKVGLNAHFQHLILIFKIRVESKNKQHPLHYSQVNIILYHLMLV